MQPDDGTLRVCDGLGEDEYGNLVMRWKNIEKGATVATVDERLSKLLDELDRIERHDTATLGSGLEDDRDVERLCRALRAALDGADKTGLGMILRAWEAE